MYDLVPVRLPLIARLDYDISQSIARDALWKQATYAPGVTECQKLSWIHEPPYVYLPKAEMCVLPFG